MTSNSRSFKNFFSAFVFLVTWSEYQLKCTNCGSPVTLQIVPEEKQIYTVETVDKSIKLKSEADVDKLLNYEWRPGKEKSGGSNGGIIGPNAFNIKVSEVKE